MTCLTVKTAGLATRNGKTKVIYKCHNPECEVSGEDNALKKCGKCKIVRYCSPECQKAHWKEHKLVCEPYTNEEADAKKKTDTMIAQVMDRMVTPDNIKTIIEDVKKFKRNTGLPVDKIEVLIIMEQQEEGKDVKFNFVKIDENRAKTHKSLFEKRKGINTPTFVLTVMSGNQWGSVLVTMMGKVIQTPSIDDMICDAPIRSLKMLIAGSMVVLKEIEKFRAEHKNVKLSDIEIVFNMDEMKCDCDNHEWGPRTSKMDKARMEYHKELVEQRKQSREGAFILTCINLGASASVLMNMQGKVISAIYLESPRQSSKDDKYKE